MLLSKDQILEATDIAYQTVSVPEWGGEVRVASMSGTDRDAFESSLVIVGADGAVSRNLDNMRVKLLVMTLVDESGNRMFSTDDLAMLGRKSAAAIERVYAVATKLNGIGAQAEADAEKNSSAAPSGDSTSA